uniref:Poly(ADP-ribose) glycohydrolase n=1 Tax=Macrostomum lignano TaxID=282301 RepID=A0A1I8FDP4_9PLAT
RAFWRWSGRAIPVASQQVALVCEHLAVPFIETAWHHRGGGGGGGGLEGDNEGPYSVNLNPDYRTFGRAILDYVRAIGDWDLAKNEGSHGGVAIVYKDPIPLLKFEPLLNAVAGPAVLVSAGCWLAGQAGTFQLKRPPCFDSLILLAHGLERMATTRSQSRCSQPLKCTAPRQNARGATLLAELHEIDEPGVRVRHPHRPSRVRCTMETVEFHISCVRVDQSRF